MRNLLRFLIRHHFILLFLLLETIAFVFVLNFNSYHSAGLYKVRHSIVGRISQRYTNFSTYLSLNEQNKQLVEENARLYQKLPSISYSIEDQSYIDSISFEQYRFYPARVINNSVNKQYNIITINKGEIHGMKPEMGVICPEGIVGKIKTVSQHFSTVIPVLNRDFSPNGKIKNSGFPGAIEWSGRSPGKVILKSVPLHAQITIGDTIITSGYSDAFPEGIMIGTISGYTTEKGVSYNIEVELSTDFESLEYVIAIEDILWEEKKLLEEAEEHD